MEEKDWHMLKVLYEVKNITRTAELLYISQPAISYRIQNLEQEFDTQIIARGKKGVEFTSQGESLAKYAIRMLAELQKMKELIHNMNGTVKGSLRIGVSSNFARYRLPILLKEFLEIYPDVEISIVTGFSSDVLNFLYRDEVHIGILRGNINWKEQSHLLYREPICVASLEKVDISELPKLPRINYKTDINLQHTIDSWWQSMFTQPPRITMEVDKVDTCVELIRNGLGYAIVPMISLNEQYQLHTVVIRNKDNKPITRDTWLIYRDSLLELSVVRAFVDFLKSRSMTDYSIAPHE